MTEPGSPSTSTSQAAPLAAVGNPVVAMFLAWVIPGLGHVYLKRRIRGLLFLLLVIVCVVTGYALQGNLYRVLPNQPLSILATLGSMGMGLPYFFLRYFLHYEGDVVGAGYEYGTAFLLTAGLMNLLLIMDAWDIARGKKE